MPTSKRKHNRPVWWPVMDTSERKAIKLCSLLGDLGMMVERRELHCALLHSILLQIAARLTGCH